MPELTEQTARGREILARLSKSKNTAYEKKEYEDIYSDIDGLSITDVVSALGYSYGCSSGGNAKMYEGGKETDGRVINVSGNYVKDFSRGSRPEGGPFGFAKAALNADNKETFEWFRDNFF